MKQATKKPAAKTAKQRKAKLPSPRELELGRYLWDKFNDTVQKLNEKLGSDFDPWRWDDAEKRMENAYEAALLFAEAKELYRVIGDSCELWPDVAT